MSNFWGGMVYPSPHHATSTDRRWSCVLHDVLLHGFRSGSTPLKKLQNCSAVLVKKRVNDCTNQWIVSRIRGPKDHLLLTRMNSLPNSSKTISGVFDFETLTNISNQVIVLWVWQVHATYHPCFPYHFCPRLEKKTSFGGLHGVTFRGTMSLNRKQG